VQIEPDCDSKNRICLTIKRVKLSECKIPLREGRDSWLRNVPDAAPEIYEKDILFEILRKELSGASYPCIPSIHGTALQWCTLLDPHRQTISPKRTRDVLHHEGLPRLSETREETATRAEHLSWHSSKPSVDQKSGYLRRCMRYTYTTEGPK
jgi:hypothetical protein